MKCLVFFLCVQVALLATFFEEDDPSHYYHVNVVSGHLELTFQDAVVKAPHPFSITRSYSSSGALERSPRNSDLFLKRIRESEWMFQGGWSLLSHTNMLVINNEQGDPIELYVSEPGSNGFTKYECYKSKDKFRYFHTQEKEKKTSGNISRRKRASKTIIKVRWGEATMRLPDGGKRVYHCGGGNQESYWRLSLEILPSKHCIEYEYEHKWPEEPQLKYIHLANPTRTKTYATVGLDRSMYEEDRMLQVRSSDGQVIHYQMEPEFKERTYLGLAKSAQRPKEEFHYQAGRRGIGARIGAFDIGNQGQMGISYHFPRKKKDEKKWADKYKNHQRYDKVETIQFPDSVTGELKEFANFIYLKDCTEVRDYEGLLTRYFHDGERLTRIEYFDDRGGLHSAIEFEWRGDDLRHKTLLDSNGEKIFRKTFIYDNEGNVVVEKWENEFSRQFTYTKKHLLKTERDANGLQHHYEYFLNTDLVAKQFTTHRGKMLQREFFFYDEDHLLEKSIVDDGSSYDPLNLTGITFRQVQSYTRHPETGLITSEILSSEEGVPWMVREYRYNEKRERISETVSCEDKSYTIYMEYDDFGHLTRKTTPLGRVNRYEYDSQGNMIFVKEIGQNEKVYEYDTLGRPVKCKESGKTSESVYDRKGRLVEQIDHLGNSIRQRYDNFGNCKETILPDVLDDNGDPYTPIIHARYDVNGNLTHATNPKGEMTETEYNLLRKPLKESYPDGSFLTHTYNNDGTLAETCESDGTKTKYTYDPFQRMTSKRIYKSDETLLSKEEWVYSTFHLLSYTDPIGLTTKYEYDCHGRKISEEAGGRKITYAYDVLGNVERITQGGITKVQIHNLEGEIVEQWEEDTAGKVENRMRFFYDNEGRKEKAIRTTANGDVEDFFHYDSEGRLCKHIDPYGASTTFIHLTIQNGLGQFVNQKMVTDPIGNSQLETYDANGRVVSLEKRSPSGETFSIEEIFYDRAGNKARRVSTVFEKNRPIREYTTKWGYNERGLPISELEEGEKLTLYKYNSRGWLIEKTLPTEIALHYKYDGLGRLLETKSDGIHYTYSYKKGPFATIATDHILNLTWQRTYNLFGELTLEIAPNSSISSWEYDDLGRCTRHTLPDKSSIVSNYDDLHLHTLQKLSPTGEILYTHIYTQFDENGHVCEEDLIHNLGKVYTSHDLLERPQESVTPWHKAKIDYGPSGLVKRIDNSLFQIKEYQYDPLNQLTQEGKQTYQFDSLGNPLDTVVNRFNQITKTEDALIRYDKSGNLIRKEYQNHSETYEYDVLGRLIIFEHRNKNRIQFTYDPFSRLYSKTTYTNDTSFFSFYEKWDRKIQFYLYDHDIEIGTLDAQNNIQELKVLGLGIRGDIGAAIAIELQSEAFAPLHDFHGNIIALANSRGSLSEKCDMDAFGRATLIPSRNPWRFQSKRSEEHLIFFGLRFYDPALSRWLTPDPAGSIDSPNLYLYVRNSPLNRLDLFGLFSEDDEEETRTVSYHFDASEPYIHFQLQKGEIQINWLVFSNNIHKLGFTPEEFPSGNSLIDDVFHAMLTKDAYGIGLVTWQSGVGVKFHDFVQDSCAIASEIPGDVLKIGIYTGTRGVKRDVEDTRKEKNGIETPEVAMTRQLITHFSDSLYKVNPDLLWVDMPHSRAGVIRARAIEGMNEDQQRKLEKQLLYVGLAPAEPLPKGFAKEATNFYSNFDNITGDFGRAFDRKQKKAGEEIYDIEFVQCITPINQRTFYMTDHYLMAPTYTKVRKRNIKRFGNEYGFYRNSR